MVVEELGGRQDYGPHDGPRHRCRVGGREEAKEETASRLPLRQSEEPQLVGLQILLLRTPRISQHCR